MQRLIYDLIRLASLSFFSGNCDFCEAPFRRTKYSWTIRGQEVWLCPNCNNRLERQKSRLAFDPNADLDIPIVTKRPRSGGFAWLLLIILVGMLGIIWYSSQKSETTTTARKPPQTVAADGLTNPIATPPPQVKSRFSSVSEAQKAAVARYPLLGVAGSPFNLKFIEATRILRKENPAYFDNPDWPMLLADKISRRFEHQ